MAQSDYELAAHVSGLNQRTEINSIFDSILTHNSGSTAPTVTKAFMMWVDTSNATYYYLKMRNHDNTAWVTLGIYTVATKTYTSYAEDTVKLTGNQTIDGVKTFSSTISGSITGNAATATKLETARTINGVNFDGGSNVSVGLDTQSSSLTDSFTLNNTHKNKLLICNGTFNISLPTVSTIKSGDLFIIDNIGTGTLSLVTNGNNTDLSRLTVLAGEVLILQSDGGSYYRFVSRSKDFASNINISAGYTYLPNGLLMQWGRTTTNIAPAATLNITFPVAFPVDCFYSDMAIVSASPSNGLYVPYVVATSPSNLAITNTDADSTITQIRWFAIGY